MRPLRILIAVTAILFQLPPIQFAQADDGPSEEILKHCEDALRRKKSLAQLYSYLEAQSADRRGKVTLVLLSPTVTFGDLRGMAQTLDTRDSKISILRFWVADKSLAVKFRMHGSASNLLKAIEALPNELGEYVWLPARFGEIRKLDKTPAQIEKELEGGMSTVGYGSGEEIEGRAVIIRAHPDGYLGPRLIYLFRAQRLHPVRLGEFVSPEDALTEWREGEFGVADIGGHRYYILDETSLEELRAVGRAELAQAGLNSRDNRDPAEVAEAARPRSELEPQKLLPPPLTAVAVAAAPEPPRAEPPPSGFRRPAVYAVSDFKIKRKYEELTAPGPLQLGDKRPFAILTWLKTPAWGIVDFEYLRREGVRGILARLSEFTRMKLSDNVIVQLRDLAKKRRRHFSTLSEHRLAYNAGGVFLDQLLAKDEVAVIEGSGERRFVIFPLGLVRPETPLEEKAAEPKR